MGSGEVNLFVLTNDPRATLREIQWVLSDWFNHPLARAAARLADGEEYELLWPVDDTRVFTIV